MEEENACAPRSEGTEQAKTGVARNSGLKEFLDDVDCSFY